MSEEYRTPDENGTLFRYDMYGNSEEFHEGMKARMRVSHYKYGKLEDGYPFPNNSMATVEQRIALYRETGNVEWLMDAANQLMIEACRPAKLNAHYRGTDSHESPGLVNDMR